MAALDGRNAVDRGIHLTDIRRSTTRKHLFQERQLRSVTSKTRRTPANFLILRRRTKDGGAVTPTRWTPPDRALRELKAGRFDGAAVLVP